MGGILYLDHPLKNHNISSYPQFKPKQKRLDQWNSVQMNGATIMRRAIWRVICILCLVGISTPVMAQLQPTDMNLDTGIKPYESYDRARRA